MLVLHEEAEHECRCVENEFRLLRNEVVKASSRCVCVSVFVFLSVCAQAAAE
jgi:hypothetical protein